MMTTIGDNMSEYTDIKTSHLPAEVVNENFVLVLSNNATEPEKRIGQTAVWKAAAEFGEDNSVESWDEWDVSIPESQSADQLEFIARFLGYWSQRVAQWADEKRLGESNEEVQSGSNSE